MTPSDRLSAWLADPDPEAFPYETVVAELRRHGKHFAPGPLLTALERARETLPGRFPDPGTRLLARFLHTALDRHDGRFDNPSYLAIGLLELPGGGDGAEDVRLAARRRDRLFALLVADTLRFELAGADGCTDLLPRMRPDARVTAKRCRLGVRALGPALPRLGLAEPTATDALAAAREACATVLDTATVQERRLLMVTMLPVYVLHDEYMFIRMLQAYETTFALAGVQLGAALEALAEGRAAAAAAAITAAERLLGEASPLFSLVATMQPQAFLTFREFTDGASAIQSRSYKSVESLCRRPELARLHSPAFHSVPEVRERVLAGRPSLAEALAGAIASGRLTPDMVDMVSDPMQGFEAALLKWRQTHYRIAVRMLGDRRGTGYTEGVPYLDEARTVPVFACPFAA
jgi:tryptophan 2,3-dioxygenase